MQVLAMRNKSWGKNKQTTILPLTAFSPLNFPSFQHFLNPFPAYFSSSFTELPQGTTDINKIAVTDVDGIWHLFSMELNLFIS